MPLLRFVRGPAASRLPRQLGQRTLTTVSPVEFVPVPFDVVDVSQFRHDVFNTGRPTLLKGGTQAEGSSRGLLAASKWFAQLGDQRLGPATFSPYMKKFAHHLFPYELSKTSPSEDDSPGIDPLDTFLKWLARSDNPMDAILAGILHSAIHTSNPESRFAMFEAPLRLLMKAIEFNGEHINKLKKLYIAQSQIPDLPAELQEDLPTPRIVSEAGKGDVYNSSIWLGLEPTYTPLHRDPNPNLFCQLLSSKTVRLLPPTTGDRLYAEIQSRLRRSGSSRIRGFEMMDGPERIMLNAATWGSEAPKDCVEAQVDAGDALFIPKGWWHSVKSTHRDGRLNASVNWWFR